jgi:hypothetical protein
MSTVHSYPPSPPAAPIVITPPTPHSIQARLKEISLSPSSISAQKRASRPQATKVSQFLFAPHTAPHVTGPPGEQASFITRALSIFKSSPTSQTASFTLTPFNPLPSAGNLLPQAIPVTPPTPLLTFHDRTPLLTAASVTGLLVIDRAEERMLGVETSFWVAVSLAYWEFLEDREVSTLFIGAEEAFFCLILGKL